MNVINMYEQSHESDHLRQPMGLLKHTLFHQSLHGGVVEAHDVPYSNTIKTYQVLIFTSDTSELKYRNQP